MCYENNILLKSLLNYFKTIYMYFCFIKKIMFFFCFFSMWLKLVTQRKMSEGFFLCVKKLTSPYYTHGNFKDLKNIKYYLISFNVRLKYNTYKNALIFFVLKFQQKYLI